MNLQKLLLFAIAVCAVKAAISNDNFKDYDVKEFDELSVYGSFRSDIFQGEEEFVHVSSPDSKLIDNFVVEQTGRRVALRVKDGTLNVKEMKVCVGFKSLKKLIIHETASVIAPTLELDEAIIELQHVGDLKVGQIQANKLTLSISETSTVLFQSGTIGRLEGDIQNVSTLKATGVTTNQAELRVKEISKASLTVKTSSTLTASDMSEIRVNGPGTISKTVDMMSQVIINGAG